MNRFLLKAHNAVLLVSIVKDAQLLLEIGLAKFAPEAHAAYMDMVGTFMASLANNFVDRNLHIAEQFGNFGLEDGDIEAFLSQAGAEEGDD